LTLSLYNIFVVKIEPGSFKTTTYSNNDITVLSQEYLARVTVGIIAGPGRASRPVSVHKVWVDRAGVSLMSPATSSLSISPLSIIH
jgi:hypothetical protein